MSKTAFLFVACSLSFLSALGQKAAAPLVLEDEALRVTFDARTGALTTLTSKRTGWPVQHRPRLGASFELLVPLPNQRDNPVLGARQPLRRYRVLDAGHRLELEWNQLVSEKGGVLPITFTATVTLNQGRLSFAGRLVNASSYPVETVTYPVLGDVPIPANENKLFSYYKDYGDLRQNELLPQFNTWKGYWGTYEPVQQQTTPNQLYVLLGGERQGLYVGCHDAAFAHMLQFRYALKPGWPSAATMTTQRRDSIGQLPLHLEFATTHFLFLPPGQAGTLEPVVLQPYTGDWKAGTAIFSAWHRTWQPPAHVPAWARAGKPWLQIQLNGPEDELRFRYRDLVSIGEECRRHGVGAIQVVGWNAGGQDRGNPFHDPDPRLGTWQELHDAIAQVQALGVQVVLFSKFVWADRTTDWYRQQGVRLATKDPYGDPHFHPGYQYFTPAQLADINPRRFAVMCMMSPAYRELATAEFGKLLRLGAAGMLYDEHRQHAPGIFCFDAQHGHSVPAFVVQGDAPLMAGFRATMAQQQRPDFLLAGEDLNGQQSDDLNLTYIRIGADHRSWWRVTDPDRPVMVAVNGFDDREMLNLCLLYRYIVSYEPYNFKGRLADFPLTLAYGDKVEALRRRYPALLWEATYQVEHAIRATVAGQPYERLAVYRHPATGKRVVVIINNEPDQQPRTVQLNREALGPRLRLASPEDPAGQPTDGRFTVPARSAVVVLEE